ncbi:MAG: hypothetical protein LUC43_04735 [Burkholderiales bacterium]|nr:hypothetical protein [Burkholderiales bacterium]
METYEELIVKICQILFGPATHGFVKGCDSGKDAVFRGTACNFPNVSYPWTGIIVIQAKHTSSPFVLISENRNFFNPGSITAILTKEAKKIWTLRNNGAITHYFLATNRRLTGGIEDRVIEYLAKESGLNATNIHIYDSL